MKDVFDLIGRILIAAYFYYEAYDSTVFFEATMHTMKEYNLTWKPEFLLIFTIVFLIIGATMILIGYRTSLGAIFILGYLLPVTIIVYSFWNDPAETRRFHGFMFMKNLAIAGSLLYVISHREGRFRLRRLFQAAKISRPDWKKI